MIHFNKGFLSLLVGDASKNGGVLTKHGKCKRSSRVDGHINISWVRTADREGPCIIVSVSNNNKIVVEFVLNDEQIAAVNSLL